MRLQKLLQKALNNPNGLRFGDVITLAKGFGFSLRRVTGSHHIFTHPDLPDLLNLQRVKGKAKPYQVRQLIDLVERYNLTLGDDA